MRGSSTGIPPRRAGRMFSKRWWRLGKNAEMDSLPEIAPIHVLTLTPFYPTVRDDANGCFVAEPLAALAQLGVRNSVLAAQPFYRAQEETSPAAPSAEFLRYFSFPGGAGLASAGAFLFARMLSRVRDLHRARKVDVIHAHAPLPGGHAAMLLSKELNIPYVVSVHGLDAYSTNQVHGRAGEWCRRISARVFRAAGKVVCISEHVREQVLAGGGKVSTSVVYNGADPELFSPAPEEISTFPSIVSIGNLISIKGHDVLIRAVAAVSPAHPDLTLAIVGHGPERARLSALVRELGIADRVRFLERVPRREVARLLRNCTLFALPSRYEGLGCVYLEGMSAAKIVIGCHGQGIDEVIRHGSNGWLVAPDNVEQLAASLSTLLGNAMLREYIGGQARQTILNGFTLIHQAEGLLRVYQECRR
jgi:teichuronic acid biosynthesis glycosyltransferase TuaC